jgi:hypothetical protein
MFPATALAGASSSRPNEIAWAYVNAGTPTTDAIGADGIILAARSRDNVCYMLRVDSTSHVFGQRSAPSPADCVATAAPDVNPSTNFRWSADPAVQWN